MKGKLDLIISDPPLAPLVIDRYQKKRKKTKKSIRRVVFFASEQKEYIGPLKSPLRKKRKTALILCGRSVMEMINSSPVHILKKRGSR